MLDWSLETGKKVKAIIVLDIDGTLLDSSYRSNDPSLQDTILELEGRGCVFVLNSNRALEDLVPIAERFNINGILIGENGTFAYNKNTRNTYFFLTSEELARLKIAKHKTEESIQDCLKEVFKNEEFYWKNIDTVKELSQNNSEQYKEGAIVALNNRFRKYTVSTHIFQYKNNKLTPVYDSLKKIEELVRRSLNDNDITITSSKYFSNVLMYPSNTSKRRAAEEMRSGNNTDIPIIAIGDELDDYQMVERIGTFLTVGNAEAFVKDEALMYSSKRYTAGVNELLTGLFVSHEDLSNVRKSQLNNR